MRSSDHANCSLRRRRRQLCLLVASASLLGVGGTLPARAQTEPAAVRGEDLFGIYDLEARGVGVQGTYEIEGLIPGDTPIMDLAIPETLARFGSGSGYGLASFAYPGGIVANFGSLVAQSGGPSEGIPPYPIKAEAFYPAGPTESDTSQPGGMAQRVVTDELGVQVNATYPSIDAPPVVSIGSLGSATRTAIEGGLAVSRTRVALGDVQILGGVITIESLVTDLVAAHDGRTGSTAGGTVASGVKFLGLDATLSGDGLVLEKGSPAEGPGAAFGVPLGEAAGPLASVVGPVQEQLLAALGQAVPQVDDLLARAGITLEIVDPHDVPVETGAASRRTSGLSLTMSYKGREQQAMVDLVNSIPPELKPSIGPIPNPVTFMAENHIYGLALAPATVSSLATPPFPSLDFPTPDVPADVLSFDPGTPGFEGTEFSTPTAPLPSPRPGPASVGSAQTEGIAHLASGAVPAILVALALFATPLFGMGSVRLADGVLASTATSAPCPIGLDQPPAPTRPT